jgi:rhamnulokinase
LTTNRHFLAFDVGAESGRALLGRLSSGTLDVQEVHRFPNGPVRCGESLHWDILRVWRDMTRTLDALAGTAIESVGVDTWGCDYALIGERGELLENPYHYRDARTDGVMDAVFRHVPRDQIYSVTGIQFLPFNTLFQLYAAAHATPKLLEAASAVATIPDLLNYWFTGMLRSEFTNATTTQMVDARTRAWATDLLWQVGIPARLMTPIAEPGTILGPITPDVSAAFAGTPVVLPACHDTASAMASVAAGGSQAFLSSGTWSLLGTELPAPVITPEARDLNFTNEGGVCGTTRLLKNIAGMWLFESCRRSWARDGREFTYDELLASAAADVPAFRSLIDPDHRTFLHPADMVRAIGDYCRQTEQVVPENPPAFVRTILESLALKYRSVLESLEEIVGRRFTTIRVVGGGSRNRVLNQFTADATGRTVVAGPVEATALGNLAMQMLATGAVPSLGEARAIIERSFPVERFEPAQSDRWESVYRRFQAYVGALTTRDSRT